jgi:hypothetical protein
MQSDEDVELEEGTYVVERILDAYQHGMWFIRLSVQLSPRAVSQRRHQQKSTMFYYVKWQGYDEEDDCTWESEVRLIPMLTRDDIKSRQDNFPARSQPLSEFRKTYDATAHQHIVPRTVLRSVCWCIYPPLLTDHPVLH